MKIEDIRVEAVKHRPDRVRLIGRVSYDRAIHNSEDYWFEVPHEYRDYLSTSGNPWLVSLLPLAATFGESLHITKPCCVKLLNNCRELLRLWKNWYPELNIVDIVADSAVPSNDSNNQMIRKTAAFFSGGVDSFYTILRHKYGGEFEERIDINDLLTVWGFDIPLSNFAAFDRMRLRLSSAALAIGTNFVDITTNLRNTKWGVSKWGELAHGCALASVALALEKRYSKVLIASSFSYANLHPWGSHVLTDPLLSTAQTEIIHDGAAYNRVEKTGFISQFKVAMQSLYVCWRSSSDKNCGKCSKCYRTMMTLDLYGRLDSCGAFNKCNYNIRNVDRIFINGWCEQDFMCQILAFALKNGRLDLAKQINSSFKYSKKLNMYMSIAKLINKYLSSKRFFWRWANIVEKILLRDSII